MSENRHTHKHPAGLELDEANRGKQQPYWKRAHHDWRFWVALFLMLTAISVYILSDDLAFLPHG